MRETGKLEIVVAFWILAVMTEIFSLVNDKNYAVQCLLFELVETNSMTSSISN